MKGSETFPTEADLSKVYEFSCRTAAIAHRGVRALSEILKTWE